MSSAPKRGPDNEVEPDDEDEVSEFVREVEKEEGFSPP